MDTRDPALKLVLVIFAEESRVQDEPSVGRTPDRVVKQVRVSPQNETVGDRRGSVAKFGRWPLVICEREAPYLSGSHFEQYRNEFRLGLDVVSTDVPNLPFPDHCHRLVTRQRSSSRPEVAKAKPWTG